jgi:hypothetical protein
MHPPVSRLESPNKVALLDGKRYNAAHGTQAFGRTHQWR